MQANLHPSAPTDERETMLAMNEALVLGSVRQHEHTEELEALVSERTAELTATNQQLESFVYSIAHDLRAPLRSMQGFAALLVEEAGATLNEACRNYAERISKSAQFMDALLCDLLTFSRISQQHVELSTVSLQTVVRSVLSRQEADFRDARASVTASGPWPVVLAHEATLAQVLFNLTSNALKFTLPGMRPRLRLWSEDRDPFIRVWVVDKGVGISPEHQAQVFRLFTRLQGDEYPGTGTGLAIVQKGIERMGGRVGLESAPGRGSHFWFELRKG